MSESKSERTVEATFRPSGNLLQAGIALGKAIEVLAVDRTDHSPTTLDLLVRLSLAPGGSLRGVDLCRQLLKSPGYVSRVVDSAEREGLLERRPDPVDRRAQQITLTDTGEKVLAGFVPHVVEVLDRTVFSALEPDEVSTLNDLLGRVTASARALLDAPKQTPSANARGLWVGA